MSKYAKQIEIAKEQWEESIAVYWDNIAEIKKIDPRFQIKENQEELIISLNALRDTLDEYLNDTAVISKEKWLQTKDALEVSKSASFSIIEHCHHAMDLIRKLKPEKSQEIFELYQKLLTDVLFDYAAHLRHNKESKEAINTYRVAFDLLAEQQNLNYLDPDFMDLLNKRRYELLLELDRYGNTFFDDKKYLEALENYLAAYTTFGAITPYDPDLIAGESWRKSMEKRIENLKVSIVETLVMLHEYFKNNPNADEDRSKVKKIFDSTKTLILWKSKNTIYQSLKSIILNDKKSAIKTSLYYTPPKGSAQRKVSEKTQENKEEAIHPTIRRRKK